MKKCLKLSEFVRIIEGYERPFYGSWYNPKTKQEVLKTEPNQDHEELIDDIYPGTIEKIENSEIVDPYWFMYHNGWIRVTTWPGATFLGFSLAEPDKGLSAIKEYLKNRPQFYNYNDFFITDGFGFGNWKFDYEQLRKIQRLPDK